MIGGLCNTHTPITEKLAAATNTSNVPDALEIVSALFLLVVSGRFFKQHPTTVMDSWQLVRGLSSLIW